MKLIIGLGNPGSKYRETKHNIGFIALDEIAFQENLSFNKSKFESFYAEGRLAKEKVLLIKPQTFMNESGRSIRLWIDYYHLDTEDILVIYDDMDLPAGKIRLRLQGGSGGHNGIKSIIQHLGTKSFNRIKIGVGRPSPNQSVVSHVLSPFPKADHQAMLESLRQTKKAVDVWLESGDFQNTMNQFN